MSEHFVHNPVYIQNEWAANASGQVDEIYSALVKAQEKITKPPRNKEVEVKTQKGGSYKFQYATLDALFEHIRKPLTENGLWVVQTVDDTDSVWRMVTRVCHGSGQWFQTSVPMPIPQDKNPQQFGSLLTYFKRYGLCAALGLAADEDDDANVAEGNEFKERKTKPKPPKEGWKFVDAFGSEFKVEGSEAFKEAVLKDMEGATVAKAKTLFDNNHDALKTLRNNDPEGAQEIEDEYKAIKAQEKDAA